MDIFFEFLDFYELKKQINKPEICDVWCMLNPQDIPLQDLGPGLQGTAGLGLKLIFKKKQKDHKIAPILFCKLFFDSFS
jgi:hypothetical protein